MVRCHLFLAAPLSVHHLKLVGMPIGIKPGYVASGWAWHSRQVTCKSMEWSPRRVSFDPSNVLPWPWQEVRGEAMPLSVNDRGRLQLFEIAGSRAERKVARTLSGCCCVKDVFPRPYRR